MRELIKELNIKKHFTSVELPQTNGQVESANRVILRGLKIRLTEAKGNWPEELSHVLWAYRTTPHSTTGETPFHLTFGTEAVIPVEVKEFSWRTTHQLDHNANVDTTLEELDYIDETRNFAALTEAAIKQATATQNYRKVRPRDFNPVDLILRQADVGNKNARDGKLEANKEGPYRVTANTGTGVYTLESLGGLPIPRTWNVDKLKR